MYCSTNLPIHYDNLLNRNLQKPKNKLPFPARLLAVHQSFHNSLADEWEISQTKFRVLASFYKYIKETTVTLN